MNVEAGSLPRRIPVRVVSGVEKHRSLVNSGQPVPMGSCGIQPASSIFNAIRGGASCLQLPFYLIRLYRGARAPDRQIGCGQCADPLEYIIALPTGCATDEAYGLLMLLT